MKDSIALKIYLVWFAVLIVGFVGWFMNIVSLIQADFVLTGMIVARVAGIFFPPLGAVLGYF